MSSDEAEVWARTYAAVMGGKHAHGVVTTGVDAREAAAKAVKEFRAWQASEGKGKT